MLPTIVFLMIFNLLLYVVVVVAMAPLGNKAALERA
jgi:hypothetical protein